MLIGSLEWLSLLYLLYSCALGLALLLTPAVLALSGLYDMANTARGFAERIGRVPARLRAPTFEGRPRDLDSCSFAR